jgi:hypothetical protein
MNEIGLMRAELLSDQTVPRAKIYSRGWLNDCIRYTLVPTVNHLPFN